MAVQDFSLYQLFYILFGWLLGLVSPVVVDPIKSKLRTRKVVSAIRVELEDLQFRLAVSSFLLLQNHGKLTREFLRWIQPIVEHYAGNEPNDSTKKAIANLLAADEQTFDQIVELAKVKDGIGSGLKTFRAAFLEAHLAEVSRLSIPLQRRIHELRNQLDIINQDIQKAHEYMAMTFNTSLSETNYLIVKTELKNSYLRIQARCKNIADRIAPILAST